MMYDCLFCVGWNENVATEAGTNDTTPLSELFILANILISTGVVKKRLQPLVHAEQQEVQVHHKKTFCSMMS